MIKTFIPLLYLSLDVKYVLEKDAFAMLVKPIRRIIEEKEFFHPTEPQNQAIPLILEGKNVLLIAPTGTGKTEAAFLPVFSKLLEMVKKPRGIKILYITPLRSLNRDLLQRLAWWCAKLDFKVAVRHGDTTARERTFQSRDPPDILITTPETLQAILLGRIMQRNLASIQWVIIDEIHEFAEDKRGSQLSLALERLRLITRREFQLIGLSATIGSPEKVANFLGGVGRPVEVVRVSVARFMEFQIICPSPSEEDYALATQLYTHPEVAARLRVMREIMERHQSILLFTNTRSIAEILASRFKMWDVDFPVSIHHGSLSKPARIAAEVGIKDGGLKGLVCTSSLELGIDIGKIDMCIQYMSPRQVTRLVQRVGRSGHRIDRIAKGVVITMDSDDTLEAMVIARRAYQEDLEPLDIPEKPLDALAHEIVGILIQSWRLGFNQILEVFTKAYPYRDLDENDLISVLTYMHTRYPRLVWAPIEEKTVMRPRDIKPTYQFYYDNLSMIPDEKNYLIVDETDDSPVGILDEAFVAEYGDPGTKFIMRGSPWRIVNVFGDKIYVKPSDDPTGAIPSWVGEAIPVPYSIAKEVGEIRSLIEEKLDQQYDTETIVSALKEIYPADEETIRKAIQEIVEQYSMHFPIPTERRIVIERWEEYVIIHACLGSLANRTLATILGHLLSEETGYVVGIQADSYRVMLQSVEVSVDVVEGLLYKLPTMDINTLVVEAFKTTGLFKRRMIHVARKFGAVSKEADFSNISLRQLTDSFQGTAIFDEAIKTTLQKDANIRDLVRVLESVRDGNIDLVTIVTKELTPMARVCLEQIGRWTSLISPERVHRLLLESARARLLNEVRTFVCTGCWDYLETLAIKELGETFACPKCGSKRIGALDMSAIQVRRLLDKKRSLTAKEQKIVEYSNKTADLMVKYGVRSALVLAGKNIGLTDADEILSKVDRIDDKLFESIVETEKRSLARKFW